MSLTPTDSGNKSLVPVTSLPAHLQVDEMLDGNPKRELRIGLVIVLVFFVGFLGWALFARLDAAAFAPGAVAVAGNRQTVQHEQGGTIKAIHVKEGQSVKAGDVLLELNPVDVEAAERAMASQVIGLQAQVARLMAEREGRRTITPPPEFASLTGADKLDADMALALQQRELTARLSTVASQKSILGQRGAQLAEMVAGYGGQMKSTEDQAKLINDELEGTKRLAESGYASTNRVRALERSVAGLSGQKAELSANAARTREQISETRMQALNVDVQHAEQVATELRDAQYKLNDMLPRWVGLRETLRGAQIKAPATGQVVGLTAFTVGGVIAPGAKVLDIVPDNAPLVVQAQVNPSDAPDIYVGQVAEVKLVGIQDEKIPILKGKLSRVSADSFVDERTGVRYFTAEVTVDNDEMSKKDVREAWSSLKPGLPVEVLVPMRRRTAMQYMLEPLTDAFWRSFREK